MKHHDGLHALPSLRAILAAYKASGWRIVERSDGVSLAALAMGLVVAGLYQVAAVLAGTLGFGLLMPRGVTGPAARYGLAFTAMLLGNGLAGDQVQLPTEAPPAENARLASSVSTQDGSATMDTYLALREGMTLLETVRVAGAPFREVGRDPRDSGTVIYQWRAARGIGNMQAMFQDGRLTRKAQIGLE